MLQSEAFPVVFFMISYWVFAVLLLYALARAWQKALSVSAERNEVPASRSCSNRTHRGLAHSGPGSDTGRSGSVVHARHLKQRHHEDEWQVL
jgi:hypothetical protein